MDNRTALQYFADHLKQADGLLITAGAGMGVDSGLPDFRGIDGFWKAYPPLKHLGKSFESMATPKLFTTDPKLAWGFYGLRLTQYREVIPHQGFHMLKQWSDNLPNLTNGSFVFTTNVDGQFQKAGFDDDAIVEYHGTIHQLQCLNNCCGETWSSDCFSPMVDESNCQLINLPPICPNCGAIARPNILMFNDNHWESEPTELQVEYLNVWLNAVKKLAIIELGAGIGIPTVRHFGLRLMQNDKANATILLRVNLREPQVPDLPNCYGVSMGALDALTQLNDMLTTPKE